MVWFTRHFFHLFLYLFTLLIVMCLCQVDNRRTTFKDIYYYAKGLSYTDIASKVNCNRQTVVNCILRFHHRVSIQIKPHPHNKRKITTRKCSQQTSIRTDERHGKTSVLTSTERIIFSFPCKICIFMLKWTFLYQKPK